MTCIIISIFKTDDLALTQEDKVVDLWISFPMQLESSHSNIGVKSYDENTAGRRNWTGSTTLDFINYFGHQDGRSGSCSELQSCR